MIWRIFLSFIVKLLIDIPLMLAGYIIFPFAYLGHEKRLENGKLLEHFPKWAWAWDNDDHGIDGESFWEKRTVGWSYWRRCFWWTIVRNPTFNFSKYILGFKSSGKSIFITGTSSIVGDTKAEGWYYARDRWAWEFYYVKAYSIFGLKRCVRFRAGWKLFKKDAGEVCQFVFAINPVHPYSGK